MTHWPRNWRARTTGWFLTLICAFVGAALLLSGPADALVVGSYPSTPKAFKVYGKSVQLGASLVTNFVDYRYNDKLLAQSSDTVKISQKMPEDAVIVAAYLYWGASEPSSGYDNTAVVTLADGAQQTLAADGCETRTDPTIQGTGTHYYCRRDITSLLQSHPGADHWNGNYTVGGIDAKVANIHVATPSSPCQGFKSDGVTPETVCCEQGDIGCQARYASWSMVFVYDTKYSETTQRDVFLYDGYVLLDEQENTLGQISFTINDFLVADPPDAQLTYYAMEGDKQLGNPEQDPGNNGPDSPPCATCWDFVSFNGVELTGGAGNNEPHNIMNSTPETGIDLDTFDVSTFVKPNDTSAVMVVSSGNGSLADNTPQLASAGYGEFFVYGWSLLQVNRKAPNFKSTVNKFYANYTEASPGDTLTYTDDLLNTGPLDADNTTLKFAVFPPAGTDYVPGSTTIDGVVVPDVGGQSGLASGLNLGVLTNAAGGKSNRTVTFKVKIKAVPGVTEIDSSGLVSYTYVNAKYSDSIATQTSVVKLVPPQLAPPSLAVSPFKQGPAGTVTFTLTLQSLAAAAISIDTLGFDLPPELAFISATGPGTNKSTATGGASSSGHVQFDVVPIASGQQAIFTIQAKVKDLAALQALGINPIPGHLVNTQGTVVLGAKTYKTDDPNQPGAENPTVLTLQVPSDLSKSSKTVTDLSPETPYLPGDQVKFAIVIQNSGAGDATVNVSDQIPSGLVFVSSQSPELTLSGNLLTGLVTVPAGQTKTLTFTAQIKPDTAPGTTFQNLATLAPTDGQTPTTVQTPVTTVQGGPDLSTSVLSVVDVNAGDLEPGDTLTYTLTLNNTGKIATGALQIALPVDKSLDTVTGIDGGGAVDAGSGSILWSVPAGIAAGGQLVLHFSAKVKAGTVNGTAIAENATVSGAQLAKPQVVSATVKVQANPNISTFTDVATSSGGGTFNPGDTVTYTIALQNTGKGVVNNGIVTATLDPALGTLAATAGGTVAGQTVTWNIGTLQNGDPQKTLTVTAKLATPLAQGKSISNQATLTGDGLLAPALSDDPAKPGKTDPTVFTVTSAPNLTTSDKSYVDSNGGSVQGGDKLTFTIRARNTGNSPASNVVVTDVVAPQLTQVTVTGGTFNAGTSTITWNAIPSLLPSDKPPELTFTAVVDKATPSGTTISNQGKLAFTETPLTATTNTVSFQVVNLPDFGASTKTVSAAQIQAGGTVTYNLTIVNSGNQAGTGVVVTDVLPKELENVQVAQGGVYNAGTGTVTWNLGSVAAGASTPLTVNATVKKPLDNALHVCNQAQVKANENPTASFTSPPNTPLTAAGTPTCFDVQSAPIVVVQKNVFATNGGQQLNQATVKPKTALTYSIKVKNTGNALAKTVNVADALPVGLENVVALDGGTFDAAKNAVTWPAIASLGVNASDEVTLRFQATVKAGLDDGTAIQNQALVTYTGQPTAQKSDDPTTPTANDPTTISVQSKIDFSKTKLTVVDVNGGDLRPGDALTYTLVVRNDGDGPAKATVATLPLDARLSDVTASNGGTVQGAGTPGGTVTWQLGTLAPGDSVTLTVQAKVKTPQLNGAVIVEQAQVTATGLQVPVLSDADLNTAIREPTTLTVVAKADLSPSHWTVQDVNGGALEPGDQVNLGLVLQNKGDALAQLVNVQAALPAAGLTDIHVFDGGTLTAGTIAWTVPIVSITPTGDVTLHISATIAPGTQDGTLLNVIAQIPTVAPNPVATLKVVAQPNLSQSSLTSDDENGWVQKIGQAAPGHVVRLEVKLKNSGKAAAENVTVTLPLSAKWANIAPLAGGTVVNNTVTWTVASIAAGGTLTLTARGTIATADQDGDSLPLQAQAAAQNLLAPQVIPGQPVQVVNRPILLVQKSYTDLTGGHLFPGDKVRFTVTVLNVGNATAQQVQVSDDLPPQLVSPVAQSGGSVSGTTVNWLLPTLAPAQTATVTFESTIGPNLPTGTIVVNQAKAKAQNAAQQLSNALNVPVKYPTLQVDTKLTPEAPATTPAQPGDTVTLQVIVSVPTAENASNVTVSVPVDATVFDVTAPKGATWDDTQKLLTWTVKANGGLANIPGGASVALAATLRVKATAPNGAQAQGKASAREGETGISYDAKPATLAIVAIPKLKVQKTVEDLNGGKVAPLDVLRYTIAVSVTGLSAAEDVAVEDVLDGHLEVVAVGQGGKQTTSGGVTKLTWNATGATALAAIVPGATATVTFDARVKADTPDAAIVPNQAQVKANAVTTPVPSDDPNTPAVNDPTAVQVRTQSALEASTKTVKDDNGGALLPGETVTWRVSVVATSPLPLTGVRVLDAVPAGMTYEPGSTTWNGNAVPDVGGNSALAGGLALGTLQVGTNNAAVITFRTRLRADAVEGGQVSNTATVVADNVPPTPVGPATLSIGKGPSIRQTQKTAQLLDANNNGQADLGETIAYTVTIRNTGASVAELVTLDDPLPNTTHYVGSSLALDGKALSDVADGDAGRVDVVNGKIHVDVGSIDAGSQRVVTFQVKILGGVLVSNQAIANAKGLAAEPSDADNDDSNGNQPTVTQVGPAAPLVSVTKAVQDENGGAVQPSDWLRYTLTVVNSGNAKADSVILLDTLPKGIDPVKDSDVLLPPGVQLQNDGATLKLVGLAVQSGESAVVSVRARVSANVADAATICNIAKADILLNSGTVHAESKPACVTTGAQIGEGAVSGTIFEDVGIDDNVFQPDTDLRFARFQVAILPPAGVDGPVLTAIADEQGLYHVLHVPNGQRRVRVLSPGGTLFLERTIDAPGAQSGKLDLSLRPTGRVYDAHSGTLTPGVRLWLRYDEGDPVSPNALLADDALPQGQQGQTTDASGAYLFSPPAGRAYRIELATVSAGWAFPVAGHAPEPGIALLDKQGLVVTDALPHIAGNSLPRYLTRFSLQGAANTPPPPPPNRGNTPQASNGPPPPRHNFLPVEQLTSAIAVGVRLSKAQAQVGDLLYATVTVQNHSSAGFAADALTGRGGVELRDLLPSGLNLVPGAADLTLVGSNGMPVKIPLAPLESPLSVVHRISPTTGKPVGLDLPPGGSLTLRAQMVVTPTAKPGQQLEFAAQLYDVSGQQLSGRSTAQLLVSADPLFDKGMVLVKTYCDGNQNGQQDDGEDGLPGARIYADIGQFAVTDAYGRAHLLDLPPGNHLFKLDPDTLPPGSTVIGDEQKVLYLTRGLTLPLSFPIQCKFESVGPTRVEATATTEAPQEAPPQPGPGVVPVAVDAASLSIAVDSKVTAQRFLRARLVGPESKPWGDPRLPSDPTSTALEPGTPIILAVEHSGGFVRHSLEIREIGEGGRLGALVVEQVDSRDPPKQVALRARPGFPGIADLTRGRRYALRLRAETEWGSRVWSAPIPFEVRDHVTDPRKDGFTLPAHPPRLLINGNPFELDDAGRAAVLVDRPADGKVLLSLRQADGAGRDEFVTVAPQGGKTLVWGVPMAAGATHTDAGIFGAALLDSLQAQASPAPVAAAAKPGAAAPAAMTTRVAEAAGLPAAELRVMLPPGPLELSQPELAVRGKTLPSNRVEVQGQAALVDEEGNFYALVRLPVGASTLTVAAIDKAGNRAIVERPVVVKDRALFLLAIADGSVSNVGAHLQEVDQPGSLAVGNTQLAGRVALYAKGRVSGEFLGLKDLSFTAHVDTAKDPNLQSFATNLIDPTKFYPVYGDASVSTQDVKARGQLYILVEADKTKFLIGNFQARLAGIELLRYDRTLYGAWLEFTRAYGGFETTVKGFAAQQDRMVQRHTDVMRGTGGSLYYLSVRDVVEGSERIDLVIRDRISGMELGRIPQARNTDYVIDPMQGRITFKSPVSGAVDGTLAIGQTGLAGQSLTWNGHPLFIETTYEARGIQSTDALSFGGQLREKFAGGRVDVGGNYVQEGRADAPTYRVAGGDVTIKLGDRSKVTGEYAFSQSRDTLLSVSDDGGLTFGQQTQATTTNSTGQPIQGQAVKVAVDVDLRDLLGASTDPTPTDLPPDVSSVNDRGRVRAWYQWMQAGFQSGGSIAQQGMQKAGVDTMFALNKRNTLQVRYDGLFMDGGVANPYSAPGTGTQFGSVGGLVGSGSVLPPGSLANQNANPTSSFLSLSQQMVSVQDAHKVDSKWMLLGANTVTYGLDSLGTGRTSDTVAAGAAYRATDRLILRADQQGIIGGDPAQFRSTADHLSTALAAEYKIAKDLAVVVSERIGWAGQNATSAGLRTMLDKASSLYVQQRLEDSNATGRLVSSSVVGAESRYGDDQKSRAYGEYQVDALNAGRMNRAVMGLGKRFEVAKGLNLDAGYERQQTFAAGGGNTSRDALSLGGEWLRGDRYKITSRQEVRLDQGDPNFGGVRKLQVLTLNNGQFGITKEWTVFGRANYTRTQNQTTDTLEAEALEATLGAAYRPITHNWLNLITKVSHLIDMRPSTDNTGTSERSVKDILSIEPIAQLPYRFEFSQKAALRRVTEALADMTPENSSTLLLVSRLGWHITDRIDIATEYRFLETLLTKDLQHGALLETAWRFAKALRVGGGYNFTHFTETNAGDIRTSNQGGFFMRLTGMY